MIIGNLYKTTYKLYPCRQNGREIIIPIDSIVLLLSKNDVGNYTDVNVKEYKVLYDNMILIIYGLDRSFQELYEYKVYV